MKNLEEKRVGKAGGLRGLNRNIRIYLLTALLINFGFGVFQTDFNLYILSMGLTPDFLGLVLSLTPFAQALAAIPIGFLTEKIGYKRSLILVNLVVGLAYLLRVISGNPALILSASFLAGVMACGYFIIQLPFISHYAGENRNTAYTINSIIFYTAMSIGAMAGGFLPDLLSRWMPDETLAFRSILTGFSVLIILGTIPLFFLDNDEPDKERKISLSPYITGIDTTTIKFAVIEVFIGLGLAFLIFFMNLIFINHYQSTLESYGIMSALLIIPLVGMLLIGPSLAERYKNIPVILASRFLSFLFAFIVGFTMNPILGGAAYMLFRSTISLAQTLWFGFAVTVSTRRSRMATSAWLEITFQIGLGIAALAGGKLVAANAYPILGYIASGSMLAAFFLTLIFFGRGAATRENN
jgi:MFS family permease